MRNLQKLDLLRKKKITFFCEYERFNKVHNFVHRVSIGRKKSGNHILQSYDPALFDTEKIGNTCVGLTEYEMKLFHKKMKKLFK